MQTKNNFRLAHSNLYLTYNLSCSLTPYAYLHKSVSKNVNCANAVTVAYSDSAHALVQNQLLLHKQHIREKLSVDKI